MNKSNRFFTLESVTEGHPDKMCDAISDYSLLSKALQLCSHCRFYI
ncbi:S-adenosylmethionine synthetase N-terminal domain-containing protein [Floccifex porci]